VGPVVHGARTEEVVGGRVRDEGVPDGEVAGARARVGSPKVDSKDISPEHDYVLIVDDEAPVRDLLASQINYLGYECRTASSAEEALEIVRRYPAAALVLSDVHMPGATGVELLHGLKQLDENTQVVMISGLSDMETVRSCLREGAYDYLIKPFELDNLSNVVLRGVERHRLLRENEEYRLHLERMVDEQTREIRQTRDIALMTLAKLAESRDQETGLHLERMAAYSHRIAEELQSGPYSSEATGEFTQHLLKSSPLHDIGKVGIPDAILLKPGPLSPDEFEVMQTHTSIGGDTLRTVIEHYHAQSFLNMGIEIAYSHHERWNGSGYPAGLTGSDIPLAARIVALADAYDAITSDRAYKSACTHEEAIRRISIDRALHFDPELVDAFLHCHEDFGRIKELYASRLPRAASETGPTEHGVS
jgi:putative two-component system response regulator